jgi:hypothetical protein
VPVSAIFTSCNGLSPAEVDVCHNIPSIAMHAKQKKGIRRILSSPACYWLKPVDLFKNNWLLICYMIFLFLWMSPKNYCENKPVKNNGQSL